jgi:bidirectional [NiFe] hydrogenase diaphorase subunit
MHELLKKFIERRATASDLQQLEDLCDLVKHTSLCGLGQTAPNPVLSTLRFFRSEYLDLIPQAGSTPPAASSPAGA